MHLIRRILHIIVSMFGIMYVTSAGQLCGNLHDNSMIGMSLVGFTYDNISTFGYQQCISLCQKRQECRSLNYQRDKLTCELNTRTVDNSSMLTTRDGYLFRDMNGSTSQERDCQKETCPPYHECLVLRNGNTVCAEISRTVEIPSSSTGYTETSAKSTTDLSSTNYIDISTDTITASSTYDTGVSSNTVSSSTDTSTITDTSPSTSTISSIICASPYTYIADLDSCLYLSNHVGTWSMSEQYCNSIEGHLIAAADGTEQLTIGNLIAQLGDDCWVGASWDNTHGFYVWFTGVPIRTNPALTIGCLTIDDSGEFEEDDCETEHTYICQL